MGIRNMKKAVTAVIVAGAVMAVMLAGFRVSEAADSPKKVNGGSKMAQAIVAGGCFWCTEENS